MLEGKAMIKETDMSEKMQSQSMASASQALDLYDVSDCISIAAHIKKEFDKRYGGGWQCVGSIFIKSWCDDKKSLRGGQRADSQACHTKTSFIGHQGFRVQAGMCSSKRPLPKVLLNGIVVVIMSLSFIF